jgi:hypothetical protein
MGPVGSQAMISYFETRGTTNHYMDWQVDVRAGFRGVR